MVALLALPIVFGAGYLIVKKYNTQAVLFGSGILMMIIGAVAGGSEFLPKGVNSSGATVVDFFLVIQSISSSTLAKLGLIIMAVGGFSKYMGHIGAANALVKVTTKPLSAINNPYVILALTYILGQFLNVFIPSAVGLAMLLLVALYPVLVGIGCTPASVAAVLATTACLDLGPASGASNKAAEVIGIDAASYFIQHQLFVGICTAVVIAVLHFVCQKWFDKRDAKKGVNYELNTKEDTAREAPLWFAILPALPLVLLLTFSKFAITAIKIDVVTAMFISLAVAMLCDYIYSKDGRAVASSLKVYLQGMGDVFAGVVSLIIAAQTFVVGLKAIGFISGLLGLAAHLGFGYTMMVSMLVAIIGITALLSGSGNAAFFSFSNLAPDVATQVGVSTAALALPMQLSAGIFRSFSPVAGVVIACAGVAGIPPTELVKRTAIPMMGGLLTVLLITFIGA
ncbi:C4-dicarboxylate transporter DcuC (plasmid) [Photobacterium sp. DA100]|uniref:C4-dicarboxylate transporter DcuC n=1 Tax=Photobacterium sp. DA100 TaxID=3027472 RepID=UPI00247A9E5D|nr:C4-dicarboxylate transporter DcuC [Photobacterium sp. DA100]WEM45199.1 C4-dicarboxylate transporter DcuC [Photobacterium sp. DA100]